MTRTATVALAALLLVCTSKPVLSMECIETQLMLTAEYGDRYVLSCTEREPVLSSESKARDPNIAKSSQPIEERPARGDQIAQPQARDEPPNTAQAAQAR